MIRNEKLDTILLGLLTRFKKRYSTNTDDPRLTIDFICKTLDVDCDYWELKLLEDKLMSDGYIEYKTFGDSKLPNLTMKGYNFLIAGGYKNEEKLRKNNELSIITTIKSSRFTKYGFVISLITLVLCILQFCVQFVVRN